LQGLLGHKVQLGNRANLAPVECQVVSAHLERLAHLDHPASKASWVILERLEVPEHLELLEQPDIQALLVTPASLG